ncbi:hypothetical protein GJ496_007096 [Pomphorhynchus laevis]|nr:hypothetical protein GJ496_007096 [Pomphorhynchus laevis]
MTTIVADSVDSEFKLEKQINYEAFQNDMLYDKDCSKDKKNQADSMRRSNCSNNVRHNQQQEGNRSGTVDDMVMLKELTELTVLKNLKIRYNHDIIYTYINTILIAVNPYCTLSGIYDKKTILKYRNANTSICKRQNYPPHIFAIADMAYRQQLNSNENQVIVISGESGSGKTESTKLILQYLAHVSGKHTWVEQQLIDSNPILEAFGNAKTGRNDNSSRFGKFIDISFTKYGWIKNANISQYLLEKSRIVHQENGEQNYHIFYWLISGMTAQQSISLKLSRHEKFKYLGKTNNDHYANNKEVHDKEQWKNLNSAFKILSFYKDDLEQVYKLLSGILHLGQIEFKNHPLKNADHMSTIRNPVSLSTSCDLLGLDQLIAVKSLTNKTFWAQNQTISTSIEADQSSDVRDALAKGLYGRLFDWVVKTINSTISLTSKQSVKDMVINGVSSREETTSPTRIGVLDVFGFEDLSDMNSVCGFEQFCINYANERLQQFFVKHVFQIEQEEYIREGVSWTYINYTDNQNILDLIADNNMSLLALINEETIFPKSTDSSLCHKMQRVHAGQHSNFIKNPYENVNMFGVRHFAGDVRYTTTRFLDKNRDSFSNDLLDMMCKSKNTFIRGLFIEVSVSETTGTWKKGRTLLSHFRRSLDQLMQQMSKANPFFIRCIRPNIIKKARFFDSNLVLKQLRYSGIMSTIEIRRCGYPIRYNFEVFLKTFYMLAEHWLKGYNQIRSTVIFVCKKALKNTDDENYCVGKSKVYLKEYVNEKLDYWTTSVFLPAIRLLQDSIKSRCQLAKFTTLRNAAVCIQKASKLYLEKKTRRNAKLVNIEDLPITSADDSMIKFYLDDQETEWSENNFTNRDIFDFQKSHSNSNTIKTERNAATKDVQHKYQFVKFARANFNPGISSKYSSQIKHTCSLLKLSDERDIQASIACWEVIQQLMDKDNDKANFTHQLACQCTGNSSGNTKFELSSVCKNTTKTDADQGYPILILDRIRNAFAQYDSIRTTLNRNSTSRMNSMDKKRLESQHINPFLPEEKMSSLEQQHFVIGMGIIRPQLRDEIYCQVMKQLTNNNVKRSYARGWLLMAHLLSSFVPSKLLYPYVEEFIVSGPGCLSEFCLMRLTRTKANGNRREPPSWLEIHATKMKRSYIPVGVTLMDGSSKSIHLDPASNSKEVVQILSKKLGLIDNFGFSIFIAVFDKVTSLGSGTDHILDAISNCEQYCREKQRITEKKSPWRLFFRKEIFAPWHDPTKDAVSTNLIYHQICRGIRYGEYKCGTDNILYSCVAKIFMIECGNCNSLDTFTPTLLPEHISNVPSAIEMIKPFVQSLINLPQSPLRLKEQLVDFAQTNWPLLFSRFFEASLDNQPGVSNILAINWIGLSLIGDETFNENCSTTSQLLHIAFIHILAVSANINTPSKCLFIHTTKRPSQPMKIYSNDALAIHQLLTYFLTEMRRNSRYFIAIDDYQNSVKKGDLLELAKVPIDDFQQTIDKTKIPVFNERTQTQQILVPSSILHILATVSKPSEQVLEDFRSTNSIAKWQFNVDGTSTNDDYNPLGYIQTITANKECSAKYSVSVSSTANNNATTDQLNDKYSSVPSFELYCKHNFNKSVTCTYQQVTIDKALLKQITGATSGSVLESKSLSMFDLILQYTERDSSFENVESIIQIALSHPLLRDECYCQLLKQLNGSKGLIHNNLWKIMWLLTGSCGPSSHTLTCLVDRFFRNSSSDNVFSVSFDCLKRLQKTLRRGSRKFPPTHIEFEAIQKGTTQIFHRIYLPDGIENVLEIESSSRAKDVCIDVIRKLRITEYPVHHFALYVNTAGRIVIVPAAEFFFDFLRSIMTLITKAPSSVTYRALFKRKLWINVLPGKDVQCDVFVHFPQEKESYLSGYHNQVGVDKIVTLSSILHLISCCKCDDYTTLNVDLKECLPHPYLSSSGSTRYTLDFFRKAIQQNVQTYITNVNGNLNINQLKIDFLKRLSANSKIFGYTVFDIASPSKNNDDALSSSSDKLYLAVGQAGVYILDPDAESKIISFYSYKQLTNWTSGSCYIHLTIGDLISGRKLFFETILGYRIDDLLTSYVSILIEQQITGDKRSVVKTGFMNEVDHV